MKMEKEEILDIRKPDHPIDKQFLLRWSPRALSGEPLDEEIVLTLLEAARWAPSSANSQPWRFVYAIRGEEGWDGLLSALNPRNREWAKEAGALVLIASAEEKGGQKLITHSFDAGAAWMSLALQGQKMGLVVHAMAGFDHDAARSAAGVPDGFAVEAVVAVGRPGKVEDLSEFNQGRERPSVREPVSSFAFNGKFVQ